MQTDFPHLRSSLETAVASTEQRARASSLASTYYSWSSQRRDPTFGKAIRSARRSSIYGSYNSLVMGYVFPRRRHEAIDLLIKARAGKIWPITSLYTSQLRIRRSRAISTRRGPCCLRASAQARCHSLAAWRTAGAHGSHPPYWTLLEKTSCRPAPSRLS